MSDEDHYTFIDEEPNDDSIRRWGYDTSLIFCDTDEDLQLGHDIANYAALLTLASDQHCPKQRYALYIVAFHSDYFVLYRREDQCRRLRELVGSVSGLDSIAADWWREFDSLINRALFPRRFGIDEATAFAERLLCGPLTGPAPRSDFQVSKRLVSGHKEFSASVGSYRAYLYIDLESGLWKFSRYGKLDEVSTL